MYGWRPNTSFQAWGPKQEKLLRSIKARHVFTNPTLWVDETTSKSSCNAFFKIAVQNKMARNHNGIKYPSRNGCCHRLSPSLIKRRPSSQNSRPNYISRTIAEKGQIMGQQNLNETSDDDWEKKIFSRQDIANQKLIFMLEADPLRIIQVRRSVASWSNWAATWMLGIVWQEGQRESCRMEGSIASYDWTREDKPPEVSSTKSVWQFLVQAYLGKWKGAYPRRDIRTVSENRREKRKFWLEY